MSLNNSLLFLFVYIAFFGELVYANFVITVLAIFVTKIKERIKVLNNLNEESKEIKNYCGGKMILQY